MFTYLKCLKRKYMDKIYILYGVYLLRSTGIGIRNIVSICDSEEKVKEVQESILKAKAEYTKESDKIYAYADDKKRFNRDRVKLVKKYKDLIKHFKYMRFEVETKDINIIY